ncbi:MAG: flagellar assembly protein FliW [Verrucomicrobiota bacterium]
MNLVENIASEPSPVQAENTISMPMGLLGFERIKEYLLLADPAEEPFLWLQVSREENLAFLVVAPQPLVPSYKPEISPEDAAFLGLTSADDAALLSIVTVRGPNQVTLNLKGPIVLNRCTLVAKQVIPVNAAEFSVQHPLPVVQP